MELGQEKISILKTFLLDSQNFICFSTDFEGNVLFFNVGYKLILGYGENNIKQYFINPVFESLVIDSRDRCVFNGVITLSKNLLNFSYLAQIYKLSDELFFLCEYDGLELEVLFKEMSSNTQMINNLNRELIKKEIVLKNNILHMQELQDKLIERTQELEAKNQELEKISNEKSKILGIVAHDLRAPVGGIFSLSEYISTTARKLIIQEPVKYADLDISLEFSELIQESSKYLLGLIKDILDVSTIETGRLTLNVESVNYRPFFNKVVAINKELAKNKNIAVLMRLEIDDNLAISIDKIKISQVINNFLQNAIKFSAQGGKIFLEIEDDGDYITTKVIDEGDGIPISQRDRLFKMFSKTSTTPTGGEKGNGLGLYISKNIIDAHNGFVGFEENVKKGSIFYFKLRKSF
ncbi:sensor histidine kinase [Desulfosporosinus hippei]|nr:HAMP domain-containing sensor histidine kinase [Desulfosporosinus hippei]